MKSLLFDTDVLIEVLRKNIVAVERVRVLTANADMFFCSCITVGEIFAGMKPKEELLTRRLLRGLTKIPVTEEIAELAGKLKQQTKTHTLWLDDCLIAATAIQHNLTLLTKNVKHYPFKKLDVIPLR